MLCSLTNLHTYLIVFKLTDDKDCSLWKIEKQNTIYEIRESQTTFTILFKSVIYFYNSVTFMTVFNKSRKEALEIMQFIHLSGAMLIVPLLN